MEIQNPWGKNESKEKTAVAPSEPKKEKKTEAENSELDSTTQFGGKSNLSPHELEEVSKPSKSISLNQRLSSNERSLMKIKTISFPSQHALPQTDAHFKFKGKQNRTNKFTSFQVNPTTNSIQKQWLEEIKEK